MLLFLELNGIKVEANNQSVYELGIAMATDKSEEYVEAWIRQNTILKCEHRESLESLYAKQSKNISQELSKQPDTPQPPRRRGR